MYKKNTFYSYSLKVKNFFLEGHERTVKAKINIAYSLLFKLINMLTGILLVPIVLDYLGQSMYGVWLTLVSIVNWFSFVDLGLGNGLRNKFSEEKAKENMVDLRGYVSTTYITIMIISLAFILLFLALNNYIPWIKILKIDTIHYDDIQKLTTIIFVFFSIGLTSNLIKSILLADQKPAFSNFVEMTGKVLVLLFIYLLAISGIESVVYLGLIYSVIPILATIIISVYLFSKDYKNIRPSVRFFDIKYINSLSNLGIKFFIIQLTSVVLFSVDNFLITTYFSVKEVIPYQIANKYFSLPMVLFLVILQPLWSATSDAYVRKDFDWLKKIEKKYRSIWMAFVIILLFMLLSSEWIYHLWVGDKVEISFYISLAWVIFFICQAYNAIYTGFINGIGKLKIQLLITIYALLAKIPLSILFAKTLGLGVPGILYATLCSILLSMFLKTIQFKKFYNENAQGIWNA